MSKKVALVVSDNEFILRFFINIIKRKPNVEDNWEFEFVCAPWNESMVRKEISGYSIKPMNIKESYQQIIETYDLVISAHCKQLFPGPMTTAIKCVNIHPGLNPYNRGWYPQVFSIINGLPLGATIHEIDAEIDHGPIIDQMEVKLTMADTSLDAYNKVLAAEEILVERSIESILDASYEARAPQGEGNLNLKKDFNALSEINLDETATYREVINRLRALTHGEFKNAYFYDDDTKKKIFISVNLLEGEE